MPKIRVRVRVRVRVKGLDSLVTSLVSGDLAWFCNHKETAARSYVWPSEDIVGVIMTSD